MPDRPEPIPEGLDVIQEGDRAIIRRRWFSHLVWLMLFFCIAWDSFLVFWYAMALSGSHGSGGIPWIAVVFPIAHVAVGVGLTYFVLCTFVNRTDFVLSPLALAVKTYPLPWIGNQSIPAADLTAFSCRPRYSSLQNGRGRVTYDVMYVNASNREKTLVKGLSREEQAEYLVTALNRFYLPDQPQ